MAQSTITRLGTISGTDRTTGAEIQFYRYGNVVTVSCGTGTFSAAHAAKGTLITLPSQYIPPTLVSTPDYGTNGTRIRVTTGGAVQNWAAKSAGDNVIFCVTYIVN